MSAFQWLRDHLLPSSLAEAKYHRAMTLTSEVTEAVRSRKFPDPFAPIILDMERLRDLSEYDQAEAWDIYAHHPDETKVRDETD
jgi:hypothetical protein